MMTSLFSAVSGLSNHQTMMDVIGDNIANVNTVGYKASRVSFATGLSQLLGAADGPDGTNGGKNPIEVGLGMRVSSIDRVFSQGNFENTGNRNDLAIQGDGFFVVGDGQQQYYSRSGNFQLDADGSLLAAGGKFHVLGRLADKDGKLVSSATVEPLKLPFNEKDPAKISTEVRYYCNLDANASTEQTYTASIAFTTGDVPATALTELNDLDQTAAPLNNGDTITISGTNRAGDAVNVDFTYGADGTTLGDLMDVINSASGFDSSSQEGSSVSLDATGKLMLLDNMSGASQTAITMTFNDNGGDVSALVVPTFVKTQEGKLGSHSTAIDVYDSRGERHKVEVKFTQDVSNENQWTWEAIVDDGAVNSTANNLSGNSGLLKFNTDGSLLEFSGGPLTFTPNSAQGMSIDLNGGTVGSFNGITQFSSPTTTIALNQDGHSMGVLQDFNIDGQGKVIGSYSNGVTRTLGQIAIARFANSSGLELAGENIYASTVNSGNPLVGIETGAGNQVFSGYLELSTVDLAKQFTDMIVAQRGYQASARVITVVDQLLSEVTQLKR